MRLLSAKNTRSQMYAADAKLAELQGAQTHLATCRDQGTTLAATWVEKANQAKQQADDIRHSTEDLVRETQTAARRATMLTRQKSLLKLRWSCAPCRC